MSKLSIKVFLHVFSLVAAHSVNITASQQHKFLNNLILISSAWESAFGVLVFTLYFVMKLCCVFHVVALNKSFHAKSSGSFCIHADNIKSSISLCVHDYREKVFCEDRLFRLMKYSDYKKGFGLFVVFFAASFYGANEKYKGQGINRSFFPEAFTVFPHLFESESKPANGNTSDN